MSTYVMSDIHGFYDSYLEALNSIGFNKNDTLYVIGDVLSRGSQSIPLIQDIMQRKNVVMIKGNHELMLLPVFNDLMYLSIAEQEEIIISELEIAELGQEDTLRALCKLSVKEQNEIINFIYSLPLYKEVVVNEINYIMVHGGLPYFNGSLLEFYSEEDLLFGPHDFSKNHYNDDKRKIIIGHTPTRFIKGAVADVINYFEDSIAIDCGLGFGGQLGVLCLDTLEEFYF